MAVAAEKAGVTRTRGRFIVLDGTNGASLGARARTMASAERGDRTCLSVWDASGIFGEVQLATVGSGDPSARTLMLLYAADLAYRVRAEITPALEAGRLVIAAPYVATAVAVGQALGLDADWVAQVLSFAPRPDSTDVEMKAPAENPEDRKGFVEFCCRQLLNGDEGARRDLFRRANAFLKS